MTMWRGGKYKRTRKAEEARLGTKGFKNHLPFDLGVSKEPLEFITQRGDVIRSAEWRMDCSGQRFEVRRSVRPMLQWSKQEMMRVCPRRGQCQRRRAEGLESL